MKTLNAKQASLFEKLDTPTLRNNNGHITRGEILKHVPTIPSWLNQFKTTKIINGVAKPFFNLSSLYNNTTQREVEPPVNTNTPGDQQLVPMIDPTFVAFGNYFDLETIITMGIFYPVYISGPTGNGKSSMVEQLCAKHDKPLIRINLNALSDEEQLIGSKTLRDGNIEIVEGPVLIAMRNGYTLLLDECDAGSANSLLCLQGIIEGRPFYFKLKNEIVVAKKGFNVIATANTKGKGSDDGRYIGTNVLNEAFLERFAITLEQGYPDKSVETKIIKLLMEHHNCYDSVFADNLIRWVDTIRRTFDAGGLDENITTRRVGHIIRAYSIFQDQEKAIALCCNRFDITTQKSFLDLYDKVKYVEEKESESPPDDIAVSQDITEDIAF